MKHTAIFSLFLLSLVLFVGCAQNESDERHDKTITLLAISGIEIPITNARPGSSTIATDQYTGTISWEPGVGETFEPSTVYSATILITPKKGWTTSGIKQNGFTVTGATASNDANSGIVTAAFPQTNLKLDEAVTILEITGVPTPKAGVPQTTVELSNAQYSSTMSWSPADSHFNAETTYTASIVIKENAGWSTSGLQEQAFAVPGATATFTPNTKTIQAVFPPTGSGDYESTNIGTLKYVHVGRFQRDDVGSNISNIMKPYRMSETEITAEEFMAVTGYANPSPAYTAVVNGPVQNANWYHAIAFCNKLSIREGLSQVYRVRIGSVLVDFEHLAFSDIPTTSNADWDLTEVDWDANGYRLPTEMEWMWAAMGATKDRSNGNTGSGVNTTGYLKGYAGSAEAGSGQTDLGDYAWYGSNSGTTTHSVKTRKPNELELYDMSGNAVEWCWDWSVDYPTGSINSDSESGRGASLGTKREFRGGGFGLPENRETVACRWEDTPVCRSPLLGFRVVRQ